MRFPTLADERFPFVCQCNCVSLYHYSESVKCKLHLANYWVKNVMSSRMCEFAAVFWQRNCLHPLHRCSCCSHGTQNSRYAGTRSDKKKEEPDTHWRRKGKRGRRDLLRAVRNRVEKSAEKFKTFCDDPDEGKTKMSHYPSDEFLQNAERFMVSRYCNFLLQSLLLLARVFQVSKIMKNTFGEGLMTSARQALFFCRATDMDNKEALNLRNLRRHMYARMLTEVESREQVEAILKTEWETDRSANLRNRIVEWLPGHLEKMVLEGRYPRTNMQYDVESQWDHVWQEPPACLHVTCQACMQSRTAALCALMHACAVIIGMVIVVYQVMVAECGFPLWP